MNTNSPTLVFPAQHSGLSTNDIRGIKAPLEIASGWAWVYWVAGILLFALLAWWLWRYLQKRQSAAPIISTPPIPPHELARARLREALRLLKEPRPFCIEVSDTIRVYLENSFRLHAPERTTEEFLDELQASALLSYEQKQALGEFLGQCDLVKFARHEPGEAELRALYNMAVGLIDETQAIGKNAIDSPSVNANNP